MEDRPLDERDLVARAKEGDADAYAELVRMHQTIAFRTAWVITGSAAEAEDAAQEGALKAFRALGRFRTGEPFRPWLLTIVANEARNRRVAETRRERLALRDRDYERAVEQRRPGGAVPSPEAALLDSERRAQLLDAIAELPERHRLVVACRYLLELSEAETAATLRVRRGTVKSRLSRALERLRKELGDA
ncbi:MAG: RNA polymerase sigma factor [Thermoleophilaceae bacterium]